MPSDVDEQSPPTESPSKPLDYDRTRGGVSKRQFRFLLALTLINTLMLGAYILGPSASGLISGAWNEFQARRALQKQQQQRQSFLRQVSTFTAPADQIVYEEHPLLATKLLAASPDFLSIPTVPDAIMHLTPQPWQPPVRRKEPPLATQFRSIVPNGPNETDATLLLHALKSPAGQERIVWIAISGEQQLLYTATSELRRELQAHTARRLSAFVLLPAGINPEFLEAKYLIRLIPQTPSLKTTVTWTRVPNWENGGITINPEGLFRFYAAQIDPKDPSHFTIDYALDEKRNTIDGYLKNDDTIVFVPRAGRIISQKNDGQTWDLFASPATQPAR
jgi:hypothetical protein